MNYRPLRNLAVAALSDIVFHTGLGSELSRYEEVTQTRPVTIADLTASGQLIWLHAARSFISNPVKCSPSRITVPRAEQMTLDFRVGMIFECAAVMTKLMIAEKLHLTTLNRGLVP